MSASMYQDFRPALDLPKHGIDRASGPPLSWYEPRMAMGMRIIQPHAHCYSLIRKVGDPFDPWEFRDQDGAGGEAHLLFGGDPSYPDALFADPYGDGGKLAWIAHRNDGLPLSRAVENGDLDAVGKLLDEAANSQARKDLLAACHPETGEASIHVAAATCQADMLQLLIDSGADVNRVDQQGWTPIMYLAWHSAEPIRTGRISVEAVEACVDALCDAGADPLRQSPPNPSADIDDWYGNSLDWASLSWNHTFLRRMSRHLPEPYKETPVPTPPLPSYLWQPAEKLPLGSTFIKKTLYAFGRCRGEPRRIIVNSGRPPFHDSSDPGSWSWDFSGSRLVQARASDSTLLPPHPTNDDIAFHSLCEWEMTLDALLAGGAAINHVKLLEELRRPGWTSLPARVALRLLDASGMDLAQDVSPSVDRWNGGSLAAWLIEAQICSAFDDTVPLLRGLSERGAEVAKARITPNQSRELPRLEPPLFVPMHRAARRRVEPFVKPKAPHAYSQEEHELATRLVQQVMNQDVPILALAIASLDVNLIDYLVELGVSTQAPPHMLWSDFLPPVEPTPLPWMSRDFCRHLLPARSCSKKLFHSYHERRQATCAKLESLELL